MKARLAQLDRASASGGNGLPRRRPHENEDRCPLCNARVSWAYAEGSRRVALSPEPAPMGEYLLLPGTRDGVPVVHRLGRTETFPVASLFYAAHAPKCRSVR